MSQPSAAGDCVSALPAAAMPLRTAADEEAGPGAASLRRQHGTRSRSKRLSVGDDSKDSHSRRTTMAAKPSRRRLAAAQPLPAARAQQEKACQPTQQRQQAGEQQRERRDAESPSVHSLASGSIPACYAHCARFISGLALHAHHSERRRGAADARGLAVGALLPASFPVRTQPDMSFISLLLPLVDCMQCHSACQPALAATGTCCAALPVELLTSVDRHLHRIYDWLRDGCMEASRPSLNCNAGLAVKDQPMAFYLSSRFVQTQPAPDPRHYTLWATASEYEWSQLLIQPTFRRQQTTYRLAERQSADMNEVMRGYEGTVIDIVNRLALVMHADGLIDDNSSGGRTVRRILPMSYFEVGTCRSHFSVVSCCRQLSPLLTPSMFRLFGSICACLLVLRSLVSTGSGKEQRTPQ